MTEKKKTLIIFFLFALVIALIITIFNSDKSNQKSDQSYQQKIDLLNSQLQKERNTSDNSIIIIENVCTKFLKSYYSVQHSNSQTASTDKTKVYCTQELFNKLHPQESGDEYTNDELDLDYSSEIFIHETYLDLDNSNKLIIYCTLKKTVNEIKSSNDYYIEMTVENINDEWLVDDYNLIAVQGD